MIHKNKVQTSNKGRSKAYYINENISFRYLIKIKNNHINDIRSLTSSSKKVIAMKSINLLLAFVFGILILAGYQLDRCSDGLQEPENVFLKDTTDRVADVVLKDTPPLKNIRQNDLFTRLLEAKEESKTYADYDSLPLDSRYVYMTRSSYISFPPIEIGKPWNPPPIGTEHKDNVIRMVRKSAKKASRKGK